jgi:trehalose synthase
MANGVGGILIESLEECAAAVRDLLGDPNRRYKLADAGKERVRQHFLLPRLLLDELQLMAGLNR